MLMPMSLDDRISQEHLTPEARRQMLRAFSDRMLLKITAMDDPEDMPGVERAMRVAAVIERVYSRCDRAEAHAPDPHKLEAERARNTNDAIQARVSLAGTLQWGEKRRKDLGTWWDAAETTTPNQTQKQIQKPTPAQPVAPPVSAPLPGLPQAVAQPTAEIVHAPAVTTAAPPANPPAPVGGPVTYVDYTDAIDQWRVDLGLDKPPETDLAEKRRTLRSRIANLGLDDPPD